MRDDDDLEVVVRCQEDRRVFLRLHRRYFPDECGFGFAAEAEAGGMHAHVDGIEVWVWDDAWLPDFVAGLASDYRGWTDERSWRTDRLSVRARFHSGGHVALTWELRPGRLVGSWQTSAVTWLEAGEQMTNLAADLREFLPRPAPR